MAELVQEAVRPQELPSSQNHLSPRFEELALPLWDSAYSLARWLTRNPNEAEDLAQDTYLKALHAFGSFQPGTNFRAWIFRIMRNTFISSRTALQWKYEGINAMEGDLTLLPANSGTPESLLIDNLEFEAIQKAIEELPFSYREVIILRDMEEASYREIAMTLSIPIGTVMSRLARGRKILRKTARQRLVVRNSKTVTFN